MLAPVDVDAPIEQEDIFMGTGEKIEAWNAAWTLVAGLAVCTSCMSVQSLLDAESAFQHAASCPVRSEVTDHPWAELHEVLDAARG